MSWKIRKRVMETPGFSIIFFGSNPGLYFDPSSFFVRTVKVKMCYPLNSTTFHHDIILVQEIFFSKMSSRLNNSPWQIVLNDRY